MSISKLAEEYYNLRSQKDELQSQVEELQKKLEATESELITELAEQGLNRIDLDGKGSFSLFTRNFYSTEDREALINFLHEQEAGDLLSVNHQTLNAYVKELKERHGDDFIVPGVKMASKTQIRMHRSR